MVSIEFVIGTNGKVSEVRVLQSSPPFDKAAITAVKQWRYEPTRFGGVLVRVLMTTRVEFSNGKAVVRPAS